MDGMMQHSLICVDPLELVFSNGLIDGEQIGLKTGEVTSMKTFEDFYNAYKKQMNYFIELLVNSINSIDLAHARRCPLPYLSSMIEDCIGRGKKRSGRWSYL